MDIWHALRGSYEFAAILIALDVVLCLEVSSLTRQLKLKPGSCDNYHSINHLTTSMWLRKMELTIVNSTDNSASLVHGRNKLVHDTSASLGHERFLRQSYWSRRVLPHSREEKFSIYDTQTRERLSRERLWG